MVEFRLLGPLEARNATGALPLGGPKQRALLALLVLRRGEAVATERLVDELWGERPPATAVKIVQTYVSQLRRALGDGVLVTRGRAYVLEVGSDAVDAERFAAQLERGRGLLAGGDATSALATLRTALDLWRGPALADLAYEAFAQAEIGRLEELRLAAVETAIEAELALGHHAEVTPELEGLVREHPLRERLLGQLMLSLYRSGRQAEALDVFAAARRRLVDELGLEPGPELQRLQRAILAQDPALTLDRRPRRTDSARRRRAGGVVALGGALLLAGAVAALLAGTLGDGGTARLASVAPDSVAFIDPEAGGITAQVPVGDGPVAVSFGLDAVWVANGADRTVTRIDPRERRSVATLGSPRIPTALTAAGGVVWLAHGEPGGGAGTLTRIEPSSRELSTATVGRGNDGDLFTPVTPSAVAVGDDTVWVNWLREKLVAVDPQSGRPTRTIDLGARHSADALTVADGALWVASGAADQLLRLDPRSGAVTAAIRLAAPGAERVVGPLDVAAGYGSIWVTGALAGVISRVDPELGAVAATIRVGRRPTRLAVGAGAVWALDSADGTVSRIDPRTNAVEDQIEVGRHATDLAAGGGGVWVTKAGGPVSAGPGAKSRPAVRPLPQRTCSPMVTGPGGRPTVLIASDLPRLLIRPSEETAEMTRAIRLVLERRRYRAGRHRVAYQACDSSTRRARFTDPARCAANARMYAGHPSLVGVVGPFHSLCAMIEIPILGAASSGPVAIVGPSTTYLGLTRTGPGTAADEPARYYPTGKRNFVRVVAPDDRQDAALALLAEQLGAKRLYALHDDQGTGFAHATTVSRLADRLGIRTVGKTAWDPDARDYTDLARRVRRAAPDALLIAGCFCENGRRLLTALRAELELPVAILAPDLFLDRVQLLGDAGAATEGLMFTMAGLPAERAPRAGRSLQQALLRETHGRPIAGYTMQAAAAAEALLEALARSDGTRSSVTNALFRLRLRTGVLGPLRFDSGGDPIPTPFAVYRVTARAATRRFPRGPRDQGAVLDRVITPPAELGG